MMLEKHPAARFVDKGEDSKEVARLIDGLQEAITQYQVSGNWVIASGTATHQRTDIATASNLSPSYWPRCKGSSMCLYLFLTLTVNPFPSRLSRHY